MDPTTNSNPPVPTTPTPGTTPPTSSAPIVPTGDVLNTQYQLVVDGAPVVLTLKEMMDKASEASGAQKKFQEAADLRKKATDGLRVLELTQKLQSGQYTVPEVQELTRLMGGNPNDPELQSFLSQQNQTPPTPPVQPQGQRQGPIRREDLDPQLQSALKMAEEQELANIRKTIEDQTRNGIDMDPVLGTMLSGMSETERQTVKGQLYDMAIESVRGDILAGQPFSPSMVQAKAQRLRAMLQTFGVGSQRTQQVPMAGPATGMGGVNGMVPEKPIERVSSSDDKYVTNAVQRALQMQAKAMRSR